MQEPKILVIDIGMGIAGIALLISIIPEIPVVHVQQEDQHDILESVPSTEFLIRSQPFNLIEVKEVSLQELDQVAVVPEVETAFLHPAKICLRCLARKRGGSSKGGPGY